MEPRTNYYSYPHGIEMGQPFPESFEYNACPTIYVLFGKLADDVSTYANPYAGQGHVFYQNPGQ